MLCAFPPLCCQLFPERRYIIKTKIFYDYLLLAHSVFNRSFFFLFFLPSAFQSRASLVSSSDGGILAGEDTSSESALSGDSASPPCDLGLVERLLRTHPVWFLPGIQRAGAVHLLQGKEEGVSNNNIQTFHNLSLITYTFRER
jgi:hypothetical protein